MFKVHREHSLQSKQYSQHKRIRYTSVIALFFRELFHHNLSSDIPHRFVLGVSQDVGAALVLPDRKSWGVLSCRVSLTIAYMYHVASCFFLGISAKDMGVGQHTETQHTCFKCERCSILSGQKDEEIFCLISFPAHGLS